MGVIRLFLGVSWRFYFMCLGDYLAESSWFCFILEHDVTGSPPIFVRTFCSGFFWVVLAWVFLLPVTCWFYCGGSVLSILCWRYLSEFTRRSSPTKLFCQLYAISMQNSACILWQPLSSFFCYIFCKERVLKITVDVIHLFYVDNMV